MSGKRRRGDPKARELSAIRLDPDVLTRAEELVPFIAADAELGAMGRITRSAVVRLALHLGLVQLEKRQRQTEAQRAAEA
jgi:hypothetical protein